MSGAKMRMRDAFLQAVLDRMEAEKDIFLLTADFGSPVLDGVQKEFPDRFVNVGISEQNLVNVATGLALEGFRVVAYAIAPFITMRCLEQVRINLAILSQVRPMNVTLVGVIYADLSLQMPDFRAAERTFQLLTQVAGRAGRGDVPGEVFVQTYAPFHPAVQSSRNADFDTFFDQEIEMRREMGYPPFTRLTTVLFKGADEAAVDACSKEFAARLKEKLSAAVRLTGPAPAPLAKAKGFHRAQLMLWAAFAKEYVPPLRVLLKEFKAPKGVSISVNVDALSLM